MTPKVFISAGTVANPRQKEAIEIVFNALRNAGLSPRQMGVNEWSSGQPLQAIRKVIAECDGIAVIAFSRITFPSGSERLKQGDKSLENIQMPTVWNHIEAALAYAHGLPLLVIAEHGLWDVGVLESKYDWTVYWTDLSPEDFRTERFTGWIESWKAAVFEHSVARESRAPPTSLDPSKLTIGQLLKQLTIAQLWTVLSALVTLLATVATIAYRAGASKWPWQ